MSTPAGAPPQPPPASPMRLSRRTGVALVAVLLLVLVVVAGQLIHVPYAIFRPGPAQDTLGRSGQQDVITIAGAPTYPTSGRLDFTTVSVYGGPSYPVSVWQWLRAKADGDSEIVPEEQVFPKGVTGKQVEQENTAEMTGSQQAAEVVALRAAGRTVGETVAIGQVRKGGPADGRLRAGDRLESVAGRATPTLVSVHQAMDGVRPGQTVPVVLTRSGARTTVPVTTAKDPQSNRAVMGVLLAPRYTLPFTVRVNAGDVGGPSAGLMFSLAIFDKITPGALTGGKELAGTGTIGTDGTVGPIGGIKQKMVGAHDDGVDYFLAPAANCKEVDGNVPDGLTVVRVGTFADARTAVERIGKGQAQGLPSCG